MQVTFPRWLSYPALRDVLESEYENSLRTSGESHRFDFRSVRWVSLPELVAILSWASKLVHRHNVVEWILPNPVPRLYNLADFRERIRPKLGGNTFEALLPQIESLKTDAMRGRVYPGQRRSRIARISESALRGRPHLGGEVDEWLDAELGALAFQEFFAFLTRYNVFNRALEAGIRITPDPRTIVAAPLATTDDTPCMELQPIHSFEQTKAVVDILCNPADLQRVLGKYAHLDVASRGALAQILVNELGRNVAEHADASAAWLCTRLVESAQYAFQISDDPAEGALKNLNRGFLEIIICDNGRGLATTIEPVLRKDPRHAISQRYRVKDGKYSAKDLIDYAFDRLASSKRDIEKLVHWDVEGRGDPGPLASGLYWVWNLVCSHFGVLEIRSSGICGWYDFTRAGGSAEEVASLQTDVRAYSCCGTMIRICLSVERREIESQQSAPARRRGTSSRSVPLPFGGTRDFLWVGDIARDAYLAPLMPTRAENQQSLLPLPDSSPEVALFRKLKSAHSSLAHRGILVLNLCGARKLWTKQSAAPLCHFFLHMNYTGTVGTSAVVLWNVPAAASEVFAQGIELARKPYGHLKELHRIALIIFDDGTTRLISSSPSMEKALAPLIAGQRLSFDDLDIAELDGDQLRSLRNSISANTHLLHRFQTGEVALRAWPRDLRGHAWKRDMAWLEELLITAPDRGGVRRREKGKGFFRLPSSGDLVKTFFSFGGVLCNQENCARVAWMTYQLILEIEKQRKAQVQWLVSVTRSVIPLAQHLLDNHLSTPGRETPKPLFASTIEDLERVASEMDVTGNAIFVTDVVSTGKMSRRASAALPNVTWLGTVALVDARPDRQPTVVIENAGPAEGITYLKGEGLGTGLAFFLKRKAVPKEDPMKNPGARITAIDPVNILPMQPPVLPKKIRRIWPLLERKPDALKIGHYCTRGPHHYIYYVSAKELLDATSPDDGKTLRASLIDDIIRDLRVAGYDPNYTVMLHPPPDESEAHHVADSVQENTDILYRHILHRDSFASQERFSTFIEHGQQSGDKAPRRMAVVIDDGSNTGETLMGLIDAAAFDKPSRLMAYCALARLPLHKLDFFWRMEDLGSDIRLSIKFASRLTIPVFSRPSCPVCRFAAGLDAVVHRSPLLRRYASQMLEETHPLRLDRACPPSPFLWKNNSPLTTARLREAIELADYYPAEYDYVVETLAVACRSDGDDAASSLLNFGFVIACEPDLLDASIFAPHLVKLVKPIKARLSRCSEDEIPTFFALAFYVAVQFVKRGFPSKYMKTAVSRFAEAVLNRRDLSIPQVGRMLVGALAEFWPESEPESRMRRQVCASLALTVKSVLTASIKAKKDYVKAFGCFLAREMLSATTRETGTTLAEDPVDSLQLFELANGVAAKFWWHARKYCDRDVSDIVDHCKNWTVTSYNVAGDAINDLCLAFNELQELRHRLHLAEKQLRQRKGTLSSANAHWKSEHVTVLLDQFATAIAVLAESLEKADETAGIELNAALDLQGAWQGLERQLNLGFSDIFPELLTVAEDQMNRFKELTALPVKTVQRSDIDPELRQTNSRVFAPRVVVEKFFEEALRNLRTVAFANWTSEQINGEAKVTLVVRKGKLADNEAAIEVILFDNGPLHGAQERGVGEHRAIREIDAALREFGGQIQGPSVGPTETKLIMVLRHRLV